MGIDIGTLANLLEQVQPGLGQAILQFPPDAQQALLAIYQQEEQQQPGGGANAVVQTLLDAMGGQPPVGGDGGAGLPQQAPPPEAPLGMGAPPPPEAPVGAAPPPEAPVGQAPPGMDPSMMQGGVPPQMQAGMPTQGPPQGPMGYPQGQQVYPRQKPQGPPKYALKDLDEERFADKPPSYQRVVADARLGRERWKSRDQRIEDDLLCYRGEMAPVDQFGNPIPNLDTTKMYARTTAYNWVKRISSLCAWTNDRVEFDWPARSDDDDHRLAAERVEDWQRTMRRYDEDCWHARSEVGDPRATLPMEEAEMMTLLGGVGWQWKVDPKDKAYPFVYEIVPVNQIFPLSHAVTRQFLMPLNAARAEYDEIDEFYKGIDGEQDGVGWGEDLEVRITCWSDRWGIRHAIIWEEEGGSYGAWPRADSDGERWIKKPTKRLDLGFPYYNMRIWNNPPVGPTPYTKNNYTEYVGAGLLTRYRRMFAIVDMIANYTIKGALRAADPATLQLHQQGTDLAKVEPLDLDAGGRNFGFNGDDVKPLIFNLTGNPDGQSMVQMLINEMADVMPPAMAGGMVGNSGYQQMQASEVASATTIGPIVDAMERTYQSIFKQRAILALRFGKNKRARDSEYFSGYAYRSTQESHYGFYGEMQPGDIELAGVDCEVRYDRLSITEQAAKANMVVQLTNAHLMSVDTALKELGVRERDREWLKILQDGAMLDPNVLKGLVGAAIMGSGNDMLIQQWQQNLMLQAQQGQGGSPPAPAGSPSAPNPAGGAAPRPPADLNQPGASQPVAA